MLDVEKISIDTMENLTDRELSHERIAELTPTEALEEYLSWEGIQGYADLIVETLDDLRAAEKSRPVAIYDKQKLLVVISRVPEEMSNVQVLDWYWESHQDIPREDLKYSQIDIVQFNED